MSKPRVYWIYYFNSGRAQISTSEVTLNDEYFSEPNQTRGIKPTEVVSVIEKSAYDALLKESDFNKESLVKCWNEINSLVAKLNLEFSGHQTTSASLKDAKKKNDALAAELDKAKKQIEILKRGLEFYADADHWEKTKPLHYMRINNADLDIRNSSLLSHIGGKTARQALEEIKKLDFDASTEHWRKIAEGLAKALEFYSKQSNFEKTVWENDDMSGPCEPYDFENGELLERHPDGVLSEFGILAEEALAEYRKQIGGADE